MAKMTVFEGVVNGIKFDNVKEYNEYLMKLIEAGEPVSASTSTRTEEDECRGCDPDCDCDCNVSEVMMLPGCIIGRDNDKSYVDLYVSDSAIADKQSFEELEGELGDNLEGVVGKIHMMDSAALECYLKDVNEAMGVIDADYKSTKRGIAAREQEIERLQNESQKLHRAAKVLELWHDNYLAIKKAVEDAKTKYPKYQCGSCIPTLRSCVPTPTKDDIDDKVAKELEDRLVGALTKLAECFGINPKDFKNIKIGY